VKLTCASCPEQRLPAVVVPDSDGRASGQERPEDGQPRPAVRHALRGRGARGARGGVGAGRGGGALRPAQLRRVVDGVAAVEVRS